MTEWLIEFLEDRDPETVEAPTQAQAFKLASRKYDATPIDIQEVPDDE